jgi:hypothetical protein
MSTSLSLKRILSLYGLEDFSTTKVLRHQDPSLMADTKMSMFELLQRKFEGKPLLEWYQEVQRDDVFNGCSRVVSFYNNRHGQTILMGVFDCRGKTDELLPPGLPERFHQDSNYRYVLERDVRFAELENRLVINWGNAHISWHQHLRDKDKEVLEILPSGYLKPFPGFDQVMLTFAELSYLVRHAAGNRDWMNRLAGVNGVYLITDQEDGEQYIGSAYGASSDVGGIWGRWRQYALTDGTGDNVGLAEKLAKNPGKAYHLLFSILQITDKSSEKAVQKLEKLWKDKLGTRVHGLNRN